MSALLAICNMPMWSRVFVLALLASTAALLATSTASFLLIFLLFQQELHHRLLRRSLLSLLLERFARGCFGKAHLRWRVGRIDSQRAAERCLGTCVVILLPLECPRTSPGAGSIMQ